MDKENTDINEIISHQNTIQDKSLSDKIELRLQKDNKISIPSIILEFISLDKIDQTKVYDLENLKNFMNNFGEVLNIVILGKKAIVLFKTFFIANICKKFFEKEKEKHFQVRWFNFETDSILLREDIRLLFEKIHNKNIINIRSEMKDNNYNMFNNNANNNIGIKMNMNMNINNFNINTTMNPSGQPQNHLFPNMAMGNINIGMNNLNNLQQQYFQMQQLMKTNQNNINNMQNINPIYLMQLAQIQNAMKNGGVNNINNINMLINKQNNLNNNNLNNNEINQAKIMINQQFMQNQMKNFQAIQNNNNNNEQNNTTENNNSINNEEKNFGKYTCKYEILIPNDKEFQIARRLIGSKGCNMKDIINGCKSNSSESDQVKLRLRGKGSGYKEGPDNKESDEPLHLCISSKNPEDIKKACLLVDDLLEKIHKDYKDFCEKKNITPANTEIAVRIESKNFGYNGK